MACDNFLNYNLMTRLPILDKSEEILRAAALVRRLIISSPPGSGKSTKVPQLLLDSGTLKGRIAVLEPRRLAARMLAARVAGERGGIPGGEVGYRVRFEDKTGPKTRIIFETEGIMLRELASDPRLSKYSAVILDEFHERHIHGDLTLAACLALQRGPRPDLLVAVMSATLNEGLLAEYMAPCETVSAGGRMYPVRVIYASDAVSRLTPWDAAAKTCERLLPALDGGHTLVFMPGVFEIRKTVSALAQISALSGFAVLPLHGELRPSEQDAALAPSDRRKIIVATNIAETSLTIDGVTAVVDSGLAKVARFDGARGINTLFTEAIPAASAEQRAGRAGRTAPGVCARLWTERDNCSRHSVIEPEILRLDLSEALLALKICGFTDFKALRWLDPPPAPAVERAQRLLRDLNAVDERGGLTVDGRAMAGYPLHPRYSRMLVEAGRLDCVYECALAAAAAQGRGLRLEGGGNMGPGADLRSDLAAVIEALGACAASGFTPDICRRAGLDPAAARETWRLAKRLAGDAQPAGSGALSRAARCFLRAFPDRVAALLSGEKGRYRLSGGKSVRLSPKSAAAGAHLLCAGEALETPGRAGADVILSFAAEISENWLREDFPSDVKTVSRPALDKEMRTPVTETLTLYRDITIRSEVSGATPGRASSGLIAEEFISGRQKIAAWNEEAEDWLARVEFLSRACPDLGLTPLGEEDIKLVIAEICAVAKSVSDAKGRPVLGTLQSWFGPEKNRLIELHAPRRIEMPGGRKAKVSYPRGREPYMEAKIQDLFLLKETPRIAAGRVALVVHILAPSMRPVQVTKDLKSFWAESYPKLRPQLARRYPRHKWP
jgi:ATP-dependent helicase HrpB